MNRRILTALFVAGSALPLAACQGLFGRSHHASNSSGDMSIRDPEAYAAIQLATGRKALDNGQYAQAISAFRLARSEPGLAPDAYNGLAVAYAKLGRADLAARYFNDAIALAPGDERFKANLARLYETRIVPVDANAITTAIALAEQQAVALSTTADVGPTAVAFSGFKNHVSVSHPSAEMVRVSSREVRIGAPSPASLLPIQGDRAAVRIERPGAGKAAGVNRIRLGLAQPTRPSANAYPIRFSLPSAR